MGGRSALVAIGPGWQTAKVEFHCAKFQFADGFGFRALDDSRPLGGLSASSIRLEAKGV